MKAIVLAAGKGSRISEITRYIPKTMIEINGRYIFSMILEELNAAQGQSVDIGGYFLPDDEKASQAMRPSPSLNGIIESLN